jgi:hypothetical protein
MAPDHLDEITIEQCLHGYDEGHRLLKSSVSLERIDERVLLIMSDLSGPRLIEGFAEYITGYPLPSGAYYAIAKTWYAAEMDRPGCVWTQTLLVRSSDVSRIRNASPALLLFRRPQKDTSNDYGISLSYFPDRQNVHFGVQSAIAHEPQMIDLIDQLYSNPNDPIGIPAETGTDFESAAVAIWNQQWPELRLNFSFCTGSLSERTLNSKPLDLQFGPLRIVKHLSTRELPVNVKFDVRKVLSNLFDLSDSPLRDFLWQAGRGLSSRADFLRLTTVYEAISSEDVTKTVNLTQRFYPDENEASSLKSFIEERWNPHSTFSEELLAAFLELPTGHAFDATKTRIRERALCLAHSDRGKAISLLTTCLRLPMSAIRRDYISSLVDELHQNDFVKLAEVDVQLLFNLTIAEPKVARKAELWSSGLGSEEKLELFRKLRALKGWDINTTLEALLKTRSRETLTFLTQELGVENVGALLDWYSNNSDIAFFLRPEWLQFFRNHQTAVINWCQQQTTIRSHVSVLLAQAVDPKLHSQALSLKALGIIYEGSKEHFFQRHEVAAFLYVTSSEYSDLLAASIAVNAFPVLYNSLAESNLTYRAWQLLDPLLQFYEGDDWWDQCEKLRRSLASLFVLRDWPLQPFVNLMAKNDSLFREFVKSAKRFNTGRALFSRVLTEYDAGKFELSPKHAKEVRKLLK